MKKSVKKLFFPAVLCVSFLGIGIHVLNAAPIRYEQEVSRRMSVQLDPTLSQAEKDLLIRDFSQAMHYDIQAVEGSFFAKAFGGAKTENIIDYIDERINHVLPESADLESRLSYAKAVLPLELTPSSKIYTVATNIGTVLWLEALTHLPKKLQFAIGDSQVPLASSRVGIMQLGEGYTLKDTDGNYAFPTVVRVATLVHEARHSDCTGGMKKSDLDRLMRGELPNEQSCGHLHVRCPAGHPYEGAFACDQKAWGAYAIEGLYALGLMKVCRNCSAEDKKVAEVSAVDSLSRVIPLDDMISGRLGDPDMSSSNALHPDRF